MLHRDVRFGKMVLACLLGVALVSGLTESAEPPGFHPNQIRGTIEFKNANKAILDVLNASEGFSGGGVYADSLGGQLNSKAWIDPSSHTSHTSTPYVITVEAGPPGAGIAYLVRAEMQIASSNGYYFFSPVQSGPVEEEPAPDQVVNLWECVGLVRAKFVDVGGIPEAIAGGRMYAYREGERGAWETQAYKWSLVPGTTEAYLAVPAGETPCTVQIYYTTGTDAYSDTITSFHQEISPIPCDQILEITCVVPDEVKRGRIIGKVDMLGEEEHRLNNLTWLQAWGPYQNFRIDTIDAVPSSGSFELENLLVTDPPEGYAVQAAMMFRLDRRFEFLGVSHLSYAANDLKYLDLVI